MTITFKCITGKEISPYLDKIAALRMRVFRDFPYLYEGSASYEQRYLATYARSPGSLFVLALDRDRVVGAATGIPMADETPEFRAPFEQADWDPDTIFYFGESVLLPAYRGQGIGVAFFDHREAHARAKGFRYTVFCAVVRDTDHPARPHDYKPLDDFWRNRGYARMPGLQTHYSWTDVGAQQPSPKLMQFWAKGLAIAD
ncbi:MAG: GNAT family N-acetyltransferase [Marinobacter sp.]|nr:GNAT family N-acetyltransferase [Marinobacter sp.]